MWLSILIPILLTILVIVCVLLILVVLMQRPRSEGLGAAFGSGMTENIFGAQTTTVLTKATTYLGGIFFGVTLLLTMLTARQSSERRTGLLENELKNTKPAPTATVGPKTSAVPEATASPKVSVSPISSATPQVSNTPVSSPSAALKEEAKPTATPAAQNSPVATPSATP
jgi:preprotein translocase subunit SecG